MPLVVPDALAVAEGVPVALAPGASVDAGVDAEEGVPVALAPGATELATEGVMDGVGATHVKMGENTEPRPV